MIYFTLVALLLPYMAFLFFRKFLKKYDNLKINLVIELPFLKTKFETDGSTNIKTDI